MPCNYIRESKIEKRYVVDYDLRNNHSEVELSVCREGNHSEVELSVCREGNNSNAILSGLFRQLLQHTVDN